MNRSLEPLTAEERALAERLSRLDARREPAPALDAAILAAARAAVTGSQSPGATTATALETPSPVKTSVDADTQRAHGHTPNATPEASSVVALHPRKPIARWPLGLSLAASLVLAAGIGWRLASGGGSESALESATMSKAVLEEDASYASADAAASAEPTQAVMIEPQMNRVPPPPPPPPLESVDQRRRDIAMTPAAPEFEAKSRALADDDRHFEMDEAVAHDAYGGAASAFPAEPAEESAARMDGGALGNAAAKPAQTSVAAEGSLRRTNEQREAAKRETAKTDRAESLDKVQSVGSRIAREAAPAAAAPPPPSAAPLPGRAASVADQPYDEQPPVSADSPQFRQAWLQRIRDQLTKGETEAARQSLQEFRRRYPGTELPDDLKKVAATLPPPSP